MEKKDRLQELDALRGLAALVVLVYHYTLRFHEEYGHTFASPEWLHYGRHGVDLFFIISGFVIFLTLSKTRHPMDFIVSRFSRLYPAYWTAIALTTVAIGIFGLPGREVTLGQVLVNLTMLTEWAQVDFVDGVYWTLTLELAFYVIMFTLFLTRLTRHIEWVILGWLLMMGGVEWLERRDVINPGPLAYNTFLLYFGNLFFAGVLFYKIKQGGNVFHYFLVFLCLAVGHYLNPSRTTYTAVLFILFFLFCWGGLRWLAVKPLVWLGLISYSLYLTHQNIGFIVMRELYAAGIESPWIILTVPTLIAFALAGTMYALVERPALKAIRHGWRESVWPRLQALRRPRAT